MIIVIWTYLFLIFLGMKSSSIQSDGLLKSSLV